MPAGYDFPEITDDDPLYHKLMEDQAEDRRRWAADEMAKEEMRQIADHRNTFPDWKIAPKSPFTRSSSTY
jgi:hypothetical protein